MFTQLPSLYHWASISLLVVGAASAAAANYDESIQGDLSGDRQNPTLLVLAAGPNSLTATTGSMGEEEITYDQEYLRIDLPAGYQLQSIILTAYDSIDGKAFVGVQSGTTFSFDPDEAFPNIGTLLGYAHFGPNEGHNLGDDILDDIGTGLNSMTFTPPLTDPSHTLWFQQTGAPTTYQLNFIVAAIPEPTSSVLSITALAVAASFRRRPDRKP